MFASRKYAVMILAAVFTFCAACAYGDDYYDDVVSWNEYSYEGITHTPGINAWFHMDEDPPFLEKKGYAAKDKNIPFQRRGNFWAIENLPKGTKFTAPEGYKIRCNPLHSQAKGAEGKPSENNSVIYPAGTTVMYTRSSFLYVFKN